MVCGGGAAAQGEPQRALGLAQTSSIRGPGVGTGAGLHAGADPARAAKDDIGIIIKLAQFSVTERGCALF
jgi:hypothetical protein